MTAFKKLIIILSVCLATALSSSTIHAEEIPDVRKLQFAWGANIGGNIDMSGHDMYSVSINAEFGLRWKWVRFFGVGAEGMIMTSNSNRAFPLFVNFRTDFSQRRRLLFMDLRGGVALEYFNDNTQKNDIYASGGIGVTLASGKTFSSHLILAYTYLGQKECYTGIYLRDCPGISFATLRLGVAF